MHDTLAAAELIPRANELAYLDPAAARSAALQALDAAAAHGLDAGWAHWHLALADVRTGAPATARLNLARARDIFQTEAFRRGLALCDEVAAIAARRDGDVAQCRALHDAIDAGDDPGYDDFDRFVALNSRAITAKWLGESDRALTHFYDALTAAEASGNAGARITALGNLGGYHQDLFNLEDARTLCEQALAAAREAGARSMVTTAGANLILIYRAASDAERMQATLQLLLEHPEEQLPGALTRISLPIALAYLESGEIERAESWLSTGAIAPVADGDGLRFWAWLCARCQLARGDAPAARELAERTLRSRSAEPGLPFDLMELLRVASDACEAVGDHAAALEHARRAHAVYQELVGHSARARYRALQASHEFARVERQLAVAQQCRAEAEQDRRRLVDLNRALEAKVAETELLHAQLREQVLRDPLTGLHNRRYLFEVGPGLLELARRNHQPLSVALLDLDHFKALNDSFGHAAGDAVLQRFASLLQSHLRRSDVLVRYGGEEFVVLMPDVDIDQAAATMSRVLQEYQAERVEYRRRRLPPCTFSAGVSTFPMHGDRLEHLLGRADKALYKAKENGRASIEHAAHTGFATLT
jgi:diguanylate cyclase (GGDEF)-like protein